MGGRDDVGVVVIGRNEGPRLLQCLRSVEEFRSRAVYVDSGSSDDSTAIARAHGFSVVSLDPGPPFTAARARNAGLAYLLESYRGLRFVQFLDGDCLLQTNWILIGTDFLERDPQIAVVFGRRRELYPERSTFNALCDDEWDGAAGEVRECGGDILARVDALRMAGGYCEHLIAGEEPEMCVRLRALGLRIWRLSEEMSLHDANLLTLRQWWRRTARAGHAYMQVYLIHRTSRHTIWGRNLIRAFFWSMLLPATATATIFIHPGIAAIGFVYPLQLIRLKRRQKSWAQALYSLLGKFAEAQGALHFLGRRMAGERPILIEYK